MTCWRSNTIAEVFVDLVASSHYCLHNIVYTLFLEYVTSIHQILMGRRSQLRHWVEVFFIEKLVRCIGCVHVVKSLLSFYEKAQKGVSGRIRQNFCLTMLTASLVPHSFATLLKSQTELLIWNQTSKLINMHQNEMLFSCQSCKPHTGFRSSVVFSFFG